jgi:hypothetical protein
VGESPPPFLIQSQKGQKYVLLSVLENSIFGQTGCKKNNDKKRLFSGLGQNVKKNNFTPKELKHIKE